MRCTAPSNRSSTAPRVRAELIDQGVVVSRKRVARIMRRHNIRGISRLRGFTVTTRSNRHDAKAPDLVQRKFEAIGPIQLWQRTCECYRVVKNEYDRLLPPTAAV